MSMETEEAWEPVPGIRFAFVSIEMHFDYPDLAVRHVDGRVDQEVHEDLIVLFTGVAACTVHEEFNHPARVGPRHQRSTPADNLSHAFALPARRGSQRSGRNWRSAGVRPSITAFAASFPLWMS